MILSIISEPRRKNKGGAVTLCAQFILYSMGYVLEDLTRFGIVIDTYLYDEKKE